MLFRILADCLVLLHGCFVLFVVLGGLLALKWPRAAWIHVPACIWGALIEFKGWICPLTPLEKWLRVQAGQAGYEGGFVQHYLVPLMYPAGLTAERATTLGLFVVIVNVAIYACVVISIRRRRR
ncbi:MAG: DUF2784 domain-containing protein [Acidobacteria bacterium]|uniref:DUF2784 domain-containing protein n=1 Tax=Candidatus Polarisedimenticola svalbardensis TaxID=2886004 RepID=A0A8J6XUW9_9BACT|nr:DUF2784 domain-containing protein [Candidatus Polarisedimenticola svalbardensis]